MIVLLYILIVKNKGIFPENMWLSFYVNVLFMLQVS